MYLIEYIGSRLSAYQLSVQKRKLITAVDDIERHIQQMIAQGIEDLDPIHMASFDIEYSLSHPDNMYTPSTRVKILSTLREIEVLTSSRTLMYVPFTVDKLRRIILAAEL